MTDNETLQMPADDHARFQYAYAFFNDRLFGGSLPSCVITLQRKRGAHGYFSPENFSRRSDSHKSDEIAMNPEHFGRSDKDILSTLVHEMAHVWQSHYGKPSRNGYHNKEWGRKMDELGLTPSNTGMPGGNRTGQRMSHYIAHGGAYDRLANELLAGGFVLIWQSGARGSAAKSTKKSKVKYTCPDCEQNAWAKPGAQLACGVCMVALECEDDDDDE